MSSYFKTSRLFKAAALVLGGSGTAYGVKHYFIDEKSTTIDSKPTATTGSFIIPEINASWTTNHKPSVPWDYNWDKRDPNSLLKPNKSGKNNKESKIIDLNNNFYDENDAETLKELIPKASRHLILIRHGQYHDNEKKDEAQTLTKLGQEQADLTGARLKELAFPYTLMVNSTMSRAVETASIISKHLKDVRTISTDLLREGAPIPPEPPVGHWRPEVHQFHRDGSRIEAAFRQFFHRADVKQTEDSYEILVCHANVIRYFVCRALQFPPEAWLRISLHHASITWITIRPTGRVSISRLGDCGHMPVDKLSYR